MKNQDGTFVFLLFCIFLFAILAFISVRSGAPDSLLSTKQPELLGQLGDYFGGLLNPIFGFTTIALLIITLLIQKAELTATRLELQRSSEALSAQKEIMQRQIFDSRFFQTVGLINGARRESIVYTEYENIETDTYFVETAINFILRSVKAGFSAETQEEAQDPVISVGNDQQIQEIFDDLFSKNASNPWSLLDICKILIEMMETLPEQDRHHYRSVFRAHLSMPERAFVILWSRRWDAHLDHDATMVSCGLNSYQVYREIFGN